MNFKEVKTFLNVSRDFTYQLLNSPDFVHATKFGKCWYVDEKELRKWIKKQIKRKDEFYAEKNSVRSKN